VLLSSLFELGLHTRFWCRQVHFRYQLWPRRLRKKQMRPTTPVRTPRRISAYILLGCLNEAEAGALKPCSKSFIGELLVPKPYAEGMKLSMVWV
jgi:hypothetical protein